MTVRNSVYKCAENVVPGDETRLGIVAGVKQDSDDGTVLIQYHNTEQRHHKFSQVEVYENAS